MSGGRPTGRVVLGVEHLPIPIPKLRIHTLLKINPSTKDTTFMVTRHKLGCDSIYTIRHGLP